MSSSLGDLFKLTVFGESHGPAIGTVIDGCPAGLPLTLDDIQKEVDKRKPSPASGQTARREEDRVEILSGIFNAHTTGAPLCLLVRNADIDSSEYEKMRNTPRPGHADYTAFIKYGGFNDYRGGGRFSGRVTVALVMAGAVAKKLLQTAGIEVLAFTRRIGTIEAASVGYADIRQNVYTNPYRCADLQVLNSIEGLIRETSSEGDSLGGIIEVVVPELPAGLGEPYFDTLEGDLSRALFAVPAVKGIEFGSGFEAALKKGSQNNDPFILKDGIVVTASNNAGGILGGISSGMPLTLRVSVKPTPSIARRQRTVDLSKMLETDLEIKGRHDTCIVPRAVIVVESVVAVTLCDLAMKAGLIKGVLG